jgi:alkylation response protein AidB-like acyl-CoA dehydrogenase
LRRFVGQKAPREKRPHWGRTHRWPRDLFRELAEMGLYALTVPEQYGGTDQNILAAVAVVEELARAVLSYAARMFTAPFTAA